MTSPEDKYLRDKKRNRNLAARALRTGDNKGAFALKVVSSKKKKYKRKKVNVNNVDRYIEEED